MKENERKAENQMQKNVGAILHTCSQKGITLIALIITIIVMLILVGVTINVALNGGLFTTAQEAAKKTQKEAEREELMSIAIAAYDTNTGKVEKDVLNLNGKYTEEQDKTTTDKIVVKGKSGTLWQIDINSAKVEEYNNGYTFTIGELVAMEGAEYDGDFWTVPFDNFWKEGVPEELKNSAQDFPDDLGGAGSYTRYYATCSDTTYTDYVEKILNDGAKRPEPKNFVVWKETDTGNILFACWNEAGEEIDNENYTNYANLAFTISMPEPIGTQTGLTLNPFTIGTLMTACTEVTGTDGKTYYDISIDDFNELISNDTIGQQNILELEDFILTDIESSAGSSIGLDPDLYSAYGLMRPITYNTDPYIYSSCDMLTFVVWMMHLNNLHGGSSNNRSDPAWEFYLAHESDLDIGSDFRIEMYVYENKNSTSENDKYFIRFMIGKDNDIYSKEYIENNYTNVWNAEINILSWKKVKEFNEQHQNC